MGHGRWELKIEHSPEVGGAMTRKELTANVSEVERILSENGELFEGGGARRDGKVFRNGIGHIDLRAEPGNKETHPLFLSKPFQSLIGRCLLRSAPAHHTLPDCSSHWERAGL